MFDKKKDIKKGVAKAAPKKETKKDDVKIVIESYPVPCMANKARIFHAIDAVIDVDLCPELHDFLGEIKNFIDARCK